jgi:outer membrane protein TolC
MSCRRRWTVQWAPVLAVVLLAAGAEAADAPTPADVPVAAEVGTAGTGDVLTLDEAVALALQANRTVESAAMQVDRAEQRIGAARARRLPSLELQGMAGMTLTPVRVSFPAGALGTYPATGPIPAAEAVIESPRSPAGSINAVLAQPITQLHRIGLNTKLSELSRDIEREKLREQRAAVANEVRRLYYRLLQTESVLRAKDEQVRLFHELDRVVGERVAIEVALRSDGMEVKARLAAEEYELVALRGERDTGRENMNYLLGRDLDHEFTLVAVPEASVEEMDLPSAMARAAAQRPDLARAKLSVDQADTDLRLKKAENIPDVSVALSYISFINVDFLPQNVASLGLQVKWEPFDWGRRGKERAEKEIQVQQARTAVREAQERARLEVAQGFRKLREARVLIDASRLRREAAREKVRVLTVRHRQQASLLSDVLEAQATLSEADSTYDQALMAFWTARADFQKALGEER